MTTIVRKASQYLALTICIIVMLGMLYFLYLVPDRLDPQGANSGSCFQEALPTAANQTGLIVSAHRTYCDDFLHDSAVYVYLHRAGEPERRGSLVFRYGDYPNVASPKFEWTSNSELSISVGDVVQVTKMLSSVDGVRIVYSIGKEEYPRERWKEFTLELKAIAAIVVILMLGMAYVCKIIFDSLRRE